MSPRTNYDTRETPGAEDYRRRRDAKIARNPRRQNRGRLRPGGAHREGDYRSPEEVAEQDDYEFEFGSEMDREYELNRRAAGPIVSGGEDDEFTTADAAEALADRKKKRRK